MRLFVILAATMTVFLYLGHFQHQTILETVVKDQHRIAGLFNDNVFKNIHDKYKLHGKILLENEEIIDAMASGDRKKLYALSKPVYEQLKQQNPYLYIMHYHTRDTHSFLRVHKPDKYGDDLSKLRHIIVDTNAEKKSYTGLEVGKYGVFYRITFPVFKDGEHIGAFEFGIDIRYLMNALNYKGVFSPLLLMKRESIEPIFKYTDNAGEFLMPVNEEYVLLHYELEDHDWEHLAPLIDSSIVHHPYVVKESHGSEHLFFIASDLQDHLDKTIGHFIFVKELDFYIDTINVVRWISIFTALFLIIVVMLLVKKLLEQYLGKFKDYETELVQLNTQLKYTIEGADLGTWDWYVKSHDHFVNERWLEMLGLDHNDITHTDKDWSDRIHPDDKAPTMLIIDKAIAEKRSYTAEFRMRHKDGHYVWIQGSGAVVEYDEDDKPVRLTGTHQDISKRKNLEEENDKNRQYLGTLFNHNPNIVVVTDANGIIDTNVQFFKFFSSYSSLDAFKADHDCICDLFEYIDDPVYLHPKKGNWIEEASKGQKQAIMQRKGEHYYFSVTVGSFDHHGQSLHIATFTDITQENLLKKKLEQQSIIDDLTKVYNRRYFNKIFDREIKRARRDRKTFAFLMIDVDNFKRYNDNYGHDMGDEALKEVAQTLNNSLNRPSDYFFRLGGEEFGILFSDVSKENTLNYAQELRATVEKLHISHEGNTPYQILTVSLGICHIDFGAMVRTPKEIYKIADQALYRAKQNGRNRIES